MDKMSLFTILTISVPEAILNILLGLLIIGKKDLVLPNKNNLVRMFLATILMVTLSYIIRISIPIGIFSMLAYVVFAIPIFKYVFNLRIQESVTSVLFFIGVLMTLELILIPPILVYLKKTITDIYKDDALRTICTLVERFLQLYVVISIFNLKCTFNNYKENEKLKRLFAYFILLLYSGEMIYLFTFFNNFDTMDTIGKLVCFIGVIIFALTNVIMFKFMNMLVVTIESIEKQKIKDKTNELNCLTDRLNKLL